MPLAPEMFHFTACPSILPDPETVTKHLIRFYIHMELWLAGFQTVHDTAEKQILCFIFSHSGQKNWVRGANESGDN